LKALRTFVLGMFAGAALLYAVLWRVHGLAPPDVRPAQAAGRVMPEVRPAPPEFHRQAPQAPALPPPSREPGDSTDGWITYDPLQPRPDLAFRPAPVAGDLVRLQRRGLAFPLAGFDRRQLRDTFAESRGTRVHEALDLLAPRGTPVLAVDEGVVKKLFNSKAGGLTVYQFDPDEAFSYYYAHLDRYADGLAEGQRVRKGQTIGYVGTSGNAPPNVPHLHFTIFKLGPQKNWWEGMAVNPFPLWAMR
jgi:murein DD-endopeptidase MepM/ murein hydrolase activator NlpD